MKILLDLFFTDTIRKEQYTKYDDSFVISNPSPCIDILMEKDCPLVEFTLQLAEKY